MGGTLPVLARWLVGREEEIGARVGTLYAANTLGAAAGAAAATYCSCRGVGVRAGELVAVAINLIAGLARPDSRAVSAAGRGRAPAQEPADGAAGRPPTSPAGARLLLVAIGLSGFAAMVDEVTWARLVGLVFGSSVYAFGLMLLLFLAGIAIGSAIFSRMRRDPGGCSASRWWATPWPPCRDRARARSAARLHARVPGRPRLLLRSQQALQILLTAPLLLPVAILFGIAFPAAVAATADWQAWAAASDA